MNSSFLVASLILNASVLSAAITCYHCIEDSWNDCQQKQTKTECSDPFPLGNTHCFSVSGKYDNGTSILDVMARGCIDCADKKKACEFLKLLLATVSHKPLTCNMACCAEDLCNTMVPQTTRHTLSHTTPDTSFRIHQRAVHHSRALHLSVRVRSLIVTGLLSLVLV